MGEDDGVGFFAGMFQPRDEYGALARVLDPAELPAGPWELTEQVTVRIGSLLRPQPWATRARAVGQVIGVRVFIDRSQGRTLSVHVMQLVTPDDAQAALADLAQHTPRSFAKRRSLLDQLRVPTPAVDGADTTWALEQLIKGSGYRLTLAAVKGSIVVAAHGKGRQHAWTWDELAEIVARQLARSSDADSATSN
jgi:hypothetical protein